MYVKRDYVDSRNRRSGNTNKLTCQCEHDQCKIVVI